MIAKAVVRYARMSPRKARLVADLVRGRKVGDALNILRFTNKKGARVIEKAIASAKANAENKNVADGNDMRVAVIFVDEGPRMRRQLSRARGRVDMVRKPFAHVTVVLREEDAPKKKKAAVKKGGGKNAAEAATPAAAGEKAPAGEKTGKTKAVKKAAAGKAKPKKLDKEP